MLNQAWFGSVVGIVGAIIGLIGLVLYIIGIRKPCLTAFRKGISIVNSQDIATHGIEVLLNGQRVEKLNKTSFYLWNNSSITLRDNDIAPLDPFLIKWENDVHVYRALIGSMTNRVCNPRVEISNNDKCISIGFDYLSKNDGFRIDILNDHASSAFNIQGTVIGSKKSIVKINNKIAPLMYRIVEFTAGSIVFPIMLIIILIVFNISMFVFPGVFESSISNTNINSQRYAFMGLSIFMAGLVIFSKWMNRKKYPDVLDE